MFQADAHVQTNVGATQVNSYEVADKEANELDIYRDEVPMALCVVESVSKQASTKPLVVLFDSGASHTWWNIKSLPKGTVPRRVESSTSDTLAGSMTTKLAVTVDNVVFPEFFKSRKLPSIDAKVFTTECRYDAIIGRDVLRDLGLILDFKNKKMTWDECHVEMKVFQRERKNPHGLKEPSVAEELFMDMLEADIEDDDTLPTCDLTDCSSLCDDENDWQDDRDDMFATTGDINVSTYESADIDKVVRSCQHLSQDQQNDLRNVLDKYPRLFDNRLGTYPDERIHLDLKPDAVPHCNPRRYQVPHVHRKVFKDQLDRLVRIGVLEKCGRSEWIAGTFIVPKKLLL